MSKKLAVGKAPSWPAVFKELSDSKRRNSIYWLDGPWAPKARGIRFITEADFAWIADIARQSYGEFDAESSAKWTRNALLYPYRFLILRDDAYAIFVQMETAFWAPHLKHAKLLLFCSDKSNPKRNPFGAARMLREAVSWARFHGACGFWIQGITNSDLTPLARLCGAQETGQIFVVPLTDDLPSYGIGE